MKLAALGAATLIAGIAMGIDGLIYAGGLWLVAGPLARAYGSDWKRDTDAARSRVAQEAAASGRASEAEIAAAMAKTPEMGAGRIALSTLIFLSIGLPSLAIGLFEIGIESADSDWRWLPIAIGTLASGVGLIGALLYTVGSGLEAAADAIGVPEHPATIAIRSARETGTYVNERPRIEFELTVQPEGLPAYEVTKKATVPHTALGSIRPGDGFRARVIGPEKPETMEIDWSSPIPGAGANTAEPSTRLAELEELRSKALISGEEYETQRRRILGSL